MKILYVAFLLLFNYQPVSRAYLAIYLLLSRIHDRVWVDLLVDQLNVTFVAIFFTSVSKQKLTYLKARSWQQSCLPQCCTCRLDVTRTLCLRYGGDCVSILLETTFLWHHSLYGNLQSHVEVKVSKTPLNLWQHFFFNISRNEAYSFSQITETKQYCAVMWI